MGNVYFDLTEEFNARGPVALLASGQAVVYYRLAMMSKDGDWILRETPERRTSRRLCGKPIIACARWQSAGFPKRFPAD